MVSLGSLIANVVVLKNFVIALLYKVIQFLFYTFCKR